MPDLFLALTRRHCLSSGLLAVLPAWSLAAAPSSPLQPWRDAIAVQDVAALSALIARGMPVNAQDDAGATPLHLAATADFVAALPLLLAAGARVDIRSRREETALHHAGPQAQALLVAAGADPLARNSRGRLPLHTTWNPTSALLAAGIDPRDGFGMTPLHVAAFDGNEDKVAWLLAQHADPTLRTTAVFDLAAQPGWTDWEPRHRFEPGQRPLDLVRWQHNSVKWSTGRYRRALELLDAATPWSPPWR